MRAFISLASLSAVASAASVSPTQKVVQLLQGSGGASDR
jgi:hypothetical protein